MITKKNVVFAILLLLVVFSCIGIVKGEVDTITLTVSQPVSYTPIWSGGTYASSANFASMGWNFNSMTNPSAFIFQGMSTNTIAPVSGTFTATLGGHQVASGNYQVSGGSISGGAYNCQIALLFTNFNNYGYTGVQYGVDVVFSAGLGGYAQPASTDSYNAGLDASTPMQLCGTGGWGQTANGEYIYNDALYAQNIITATDYGGSTNIGITVNKQSYSTMIYVINSNSNLVQYSDSISGNTNEQFIVSNSRPLYFEMTSLGLAVNSTSYFMSPSTTMYSVTYNPNPASPNQIITPVITSTNSTDSSLAMLQVISAWDETTYQSAGPSTQNALNSTAYGGNMYSVDYTKLSNGTWTYYNKTSSIFQNTGTQITTNLPLGITIPTSGNHNITWQLIDVKGNSYLFNSYLNVTGTTGQVYIYPVDYVTRQIVIGSTIYFGPANGLMVPYTVNSYANCLFNVNQGWYDFAVQDTNPYYNQLNNNYNVTLNTPVELVQVSSTPQTETWYLIPQNQASTGNATLIISAVDANTLNTINNALIEIAEVNGSFAYSGYTDKFSGQLSIQLPANNYYDLYANANGYPQGQVMNYYVGTGTQTSQIAMNGITILTTQPTPTIVIPTIPTIPTPINQGIGSSANSTSGIYGNGTCAVYPATQNLTLIQMVENWGACNGVSSQQNNNILIGLGIILLCGAVLGKVTKSGLGAIAGVIAAYAACLALQLMPVWTFFAVLIIGFLALAFKLGGTK